MSNYLICLLITVCASGLTAQTTDSFTLTPDWEEGLSQRYVIEGYNLVGQNAMSGTKQLIHSGVTLTVKEKTNEHYIIGFVYDSIRQQTEADTLPGQPYFISPQGPDLGPVISWPISVLEMKLGLDGRYLGVRNEKKIEAEMQAFMDRTYKQMGMLDSTSMNIFKGIMGNSIAMKAADIGRYYHMQFFNLMGKRYPLGESFEVEQQIPMGQLEIAGLSEYDCKMDIQKGNPDTLVYTERALSEEDFMKQVMKMVSENMPEDVNLPDSFNFEEIMGGMTSTMMILTEKKFSLDNQLPIYISTEASTQMNMGMMQGMYSENRTTFRAVD